MLCISGSRTFKDPDKMRRKLEGFLNLLDPEAEIAVGCAKSGVDLWVREWAKDNDHPYTVFKADWDKLGRSAGPVRNKQMVHFSDAVVAFWNGSSNGTGGTISLARDWRNLLFVYEEDA
jgi:hypothetical protein